LRQDRQTQGGAFHGRGLAQEGKKKGVTKKPAAGISRKKKRTEGGEKKAK